MVRSKLKNKYMNNMSVESKRSYTRQRNYCGKLLRKKSKTFLLNLNTENITDNKIFLQIVKPVFSDKTLDSDQITLISNDEIFSDEENICKTFNDLFSNVIKNLNVIVDKRLANQNLDFRKSCTEGYSLV